jgi:hypothetical protein
MVLKKVSVLIVVVLLMAPGCSSSSTATLPENATNSAPDVGTSVGGADTGEKNAPVEQKLRPR